MMLTTGCISERDRATNYQDDDNSTTTNATGETATTTTTDDDDDDDTTTTTTDEEADSEIPDDIDHCTWSSDGEDDFASTSDHLGDYTACQSSDDSNIVYIQLKTPVTDSEVCLFPMSDQVYSSYGNDPRYIGSGKCQMIEDNLTIYKFEFEIDRNGFESYTTTGIIAMKDQMYFFPSPFYSYMLSPDAFLTCMIMYDVYLDSSYCQAFDYTGEYIYHDF